MPNLIPEKRLDRNGRLVTKHVKASPSVTAPKTSLPSPTMAPAVKPKKVPAARTKPFRWDVYKTLCGADKELVTATNRYNRYLNYDFEASDVEAYEVMSVVAPHNIIPVLASLPPGGRTRAAAKELLTVEGLEHFIEDNSLLAEGALARNVPARVVADMISTFPAANRTTSHYFDALEAFSVKGYRETSIYSRPGYVEQLLAGTINLSDLKTLGPARIKAGGTGSAIIDQLEKLHSGTAKMTVDDLATVISKATEEKSAHSTIVNEAIWFAERHGVELAMDMKDIAMATQFSNGLIHAAYTGPLEDILKWHDEVRSERYMGHIPVEDLIAMFDAGVKPREVDEGLGKKLSVQQIIGIHTEGISTAVSSGWL